MTNFSRSLRRRAEKKSVSDLPLSLLFFCFVGRCVFFGSKLLKPSTYMRSPIVLIERKMLPMADRSWVVYTVPHAAPTSDWGRARHMQDTAALAFHAALHAAVAVYHVTQHSFVNRQLSRAVVDLNRPEGTESGFVPEYRNFLQKHHRQVGLVIDVHSFPLTRPPTFGVDADVVVLEHPTSQALSRSLHSHLSRAGVSSAIVQGADCAELLENEAKECNALQAYAGAEMQLPALLLEFSERAMTSDERRRIVDPIAAFIAGRVPASTVTTTSVFREAVQAIQAVSDLDQLKHETDPEQRLRIIVDLLRGHSNTPRSVNAPTGGGGGGGKRQKTMEMEAVTRTLLEDLRAFVGPPELIQQILVLLLPRERELLATATKAMARAVELFYATHSTGGAWTLFVEAFMSNDEEEVDEDEEDENEEERWAQFLNSWSRALDIRLQRGHGVDYRRRRPSAPRYKLEQAHGSLHMIARDLVHRAGFVAGLFTGTYPGVLHQLLFFHDAIAQDFFGLQILREGDRLWFHEHVAKYRSLIYLYKTNVVRLLWPVLQRMVVAVDQQRWTDDEKDDQEFMLRFLAVFPPELPTDAFGEPLVASFPDSTLSTFVPEEMGMLLVRRGVQRWIDEHDVTIPLWTGSEPEPGPPRMVDLYHFRDFLDTTPELLVWMLEWRELKPPIFEMLPHTSGTWKPVSIFHCFFQRGTMHPGYWRRTPGALIEAEAMPTEEQNSMRVVLQSLTELLSILQDMGILERVHFELTGDIKMFLTGSAFQHHPFNITPYVRGLNKDGSRLESIGFVWRRRKADNDWFVEQLWNLNITTNVPAVHARFT